MLHPVRLWLLPLMITACGFPRPPLTGDDAGDIHGDASGDAQGVPGVTVHVSPAGDDANDGLILPIKTLKHAIGIAGASGEIRTIVLASGRYSSDSGETFPYTVPANVAIIGPAGGGAILVGTDTEPGLVVGAGKLADLEFEHFTVAVTATGSAEFTGIRVRASRLALRGEASSRVTAAGVDVTGVTGACATAVELNADANLMISDFAARGYGVSFNAKDQSVLAASGANIVGDNTCNLPSAGAFLIATATTFSVSDSLIDGGTNGIWISGVLASTRAMITNVTIRNTIKIAIYAESVKLLMSGGEISNGQDGISTGSGSFGLTNVLIRHLQGLPVEGGFGPKGGGIITMRSCKLTDNASGSYIFSYIDLGTAASPGNNTFQNGRSLDEFEFQDTAPIRIDAVGNTWRPSTQGSDPSGHYASMLVSSGQPGSNFVLGPGWTLQL